MLSFNNLSEERPIVFFDSHPEPPAGIVWDSVTRLKKHLAIAWTGDVVLDVQPGMVRLQWYTTDGKFGKKDYELREHDDARAGFDTLCGLADVARCMVVGYASQNPYSLFGDSPYVLHERKRSALLQSPEYRDFVPAAKRGGGGNVGLRVEELIDLEDKKDAARAQAQGGAGSQGV